MEKFRWKTNEFRQVYDSPDEELIEVDNDGYMI